MSRTEIRITGFGGQGVVLSGYIIGRACAIDAGNHATMIQSFGPEARGSACSATLAVSDDEVLYPHIHRPESIPNGRDPAYRSDVHPETESRTRGSFQSRAWPRKSRKTAILRV